MKFPKRCPISQASTIFFFSPVTDMVIKATVIRYIRANNMDLAQFVAQYDNGRTFHIAVEDVLSWRN